MEDSFLPFVWMQVDDDFREYLGLKPDFKGEIPALLWKVEGGSLEDGTQFELTDREMALACLMMIRMAATIDEDDEEALPVNVDTLIHVVEWYRAAYEFNDLEELVLSLADFAKENINNAIQLELLKSGTMLVPDSTEITSRIASIEPTIDRGEGH